MPAARRGRGARVVSLRLHQATWPHAALPARLAEHDAVVCTASLLAGGDDVRAMATVLAPSERSRLETYTNDVVARRYLRGRMLLRVMLGAARGVAPAEVPVREGPHGKPYLVAGKARPIWFSVSHCDELFVLAVSRKADVGVDVERERAIEQWQRVADRVLDPRERRQLDRAVEDGDDPSEAFLRHWCRVEAELKAIGCGIHGLEAHRAGLRPRGLWVGDLRGLPLPADVGAAGGRYQAALALCVPGTDPLRHRYVASAHATIPVTTPARTSTP
jgi:phosphopantetheinyl transferase